MKTGPVDPRAVSGGYKSYVLSALLIVYIFNFIDRQIVSALQEPIKAEFGLSDTQLGLMTGTAFAIFYTLLGIPIARLADRWNRVSIISISLIIWSGFTALFGLAQSFLFLLLTRIGVGIGEAGCSPPSHSLLSDYFPSKKRARALAIYALGIPIGSVVGILMGSYIYNWVGDYYAANGVPAIMSALGAESAWRAPFLVLGVAGVALGVFVWTTLGEPKRGAYDTHADLTQPSLGKVFSALAGKPSFWLLSLGAAIASMVGYGLFPWLFSFFVRGLDDFMELREAVTTAALPYAFVIGVGGSLGTWVGGWLTDKFAGGRLGVRAYVIIPGAALLIALPIYLAAVSMPVFIVSVLLLLVPTALGAMWYGPLFATIQNLVAPGLRAMASAVMLFIVNIIGLGIGPLLTGAISDGLRAQYGEDSLKLAIMIISSFLLLSAALFFLSARTIQRDWEARDEEEDAVDAIKDADL